MLYWIYIYHNHSATVPQCCTLLHHKVTFLKLADYFHRIYATPSLTPH